MTTRHLLSDQMYCFNLNTAFPPFFCIFAIPQVSQSKRFGLSGSGEYVLKASE